MIDDKQWRACDGNRIVATKNRNPVDQRDVVTSRYLQPLISVWGCGTVFIPREAPTQPMATNGDDGWRKTAICGRQGSLIWKTGASCFPQGCPPGHSPFPDSTPSCRSNASNHVNWLAAGGRKSPIRTRQCGGRITAVGGPCLPKSNGCPYKFHQ
jgi:hypothetical protein